MKTVEELSKEYSKRYPIRHLMTGAVIEDFSEDIETAYSAGYEEAMKETRDRESVIVARYEEEIARLMDLCSTYERDLGIE